MQWTVEDLPNGVARLNLAGRIDVQGALAVDPVFEDLARKQSKLVVDMSDVTFLASLGIRTLVSCCKALADKGGELVLLAPQPGVEKVLKTSGISTIIPIVSQMSEAEPLLHK